MERTEDIVKKRSYDGTRRRQQAERTRSAVVAAARARFLRDGVGATTIASIAADAGVSADTVYKAFGGKPGLIRAIVDESLAGVGPVPAEARSDALQRSGADGRAIIGGFGSLTVEVAPRVTPILLMVRQAAAVDVAMAEVWADLEAQRLQRMTHNARNLAAAGHVRPGVTTKQAGEILWAYTSPELYERLVLQQRWSLRRFGAFIEEALAAALLPPQE